jgi:hypothetical protein
MYLAIESLVHCYALIKFVGLIDKNSDITRKSCEIKRLNGTIPKFESIFLVFLSRVYELHRIMQNTSSVP